MPVDDAVVLDLVRAALTSGVDVVGAVTAVGTALPETQGAPYLRAAKALRLGSAWDVAWSDRSVVSDALEPAWADGVDPEPLLRHAAAAIRRTRQARAREAAARLGVRLVLPLGLCLLPAFVLLGLVPVLLAAGLELWGG
ncbi:secretion system protein [Pseudactinotalea sp.]|uniref:secretion system protein n=1 Tax=Pseudactinotalea sp. TaxID=1926260 RepID=UPI003B3BBD38